MVCDATFFRKRKDKDGLLIFYDSISDKVIWHKFIQSETKAEYQEGLDYLLKLGFEIQSVTIDGRRGVANVFKDYPVQICQFHVQTNILKRTTQNPQTKSGKILKRIANLFIRNKWNQKYFENCFYGLVIKYRDFFIERNENGQFIHRSLRSALFGIKSVLPYLFTYQDYPNLNIPNTTNNIDGGINTKLKYLNRRHRGMNIERRNKLLINLLYNLRGK